MSEVQQNCASCIFWKDLEADSNYLPAHAGLCRRRPPLLALDAGRDDEHDMCWGDWPLTQGKDWCGDYKPAK
jgi:hypothetical protein